jgi:2-succinyl-6-hydroxy-2,4-cyclohexadiene-1-carboxylate synthase
VQHFAAWWEDTPIIATQERIPEPYRTALLKRRRTNQPIGLVNSLRSMGTGAMPSLWGRLSQIGIPTFLAVGDGDSKFAEIAERMLDELPQACFRSIPDAGHAAHLESSRAFAAELASFLRGLV